MATVEIIYSKKRVKPSNEELDTVQRAKNNGCDYKRAVDILMQAQQYWFNMWKFRRDRKRNKDYCYGDQWKDLIVVDGKQMTEEDYIRRQGNVPLKNNLIRRLVRNVLGVYSSQSTEPTCTARDRDEQKLGETMSVILQCNMQLNRSADLLARSMEEFLISGLVVHRKWYGWRNDKMDCWTDPVQPNNFFIDNHMRDYRGWDVSFIGEIHDVSFETLCSQFALCEADYQKLAEIYADARDRDYLMGVMHSFGYGDEDMNLDFLAPFDTTRCRVIEVWRKESKPRFRCHDYNSGEVFKIDVEDFDVMVTKVNMERLQRGVAQGMSPDDIPLIESSWMMDEYWYYYYLSPRGDILAEGETPYAHKSHPYVFKAYPFIDGEIHSFVSDVIDQQRYTNRLIMMYDWIMRASAKGVLLVPEGSLPEHTSPEEFSETWAKFNGVLFYKPKAGVAAPTQIANNSTNIGISELLNMQLKFFEDISGVNGALQGKPGYSGTSGALYSQQVQNATTSLLDLLNSFSQFVVDSAYKDVKNIQQFYDEKRVFNIAGKSAIFEYDPEKIRDVEFDLSIVESTATPVYRAMSNDFLMEMWRANQITLQQLLQAGDFPFADNLLQSIQSSQEQMQANQQPQGIPSDISSQVSENSDEQAVDMAEKALKNS